MTDEKALLQRRIIRLSGVIDETSATRVMTQLLYLQHLSNDEPVSLTIASGGGSVAEALGIHDVIRHIKPPVHTHCDCIAMGMAALLLACGEKGHRTATRSAHFGFGHFSVKDEGGSDIKEVQKTIEVITSLYRSYTKATDEWLTTMMKFDVGFSSEEAVKVGFIDRIVDDVENL